MGNSSELQQEEVASGGAVTRLDAVEADLLISEIERRPGILDLDLDGWSAWATLRFPLQVALAYEFSPGRGQGRRGSRVLLPLRQLVRLLRVKPTPVLIKSYSTGLLEETERGYEDVWFDRFLPQVGTFGKVMTDLNPSFRSHLAGAAVPPMMTTALLDVLVGLHRRTDRDRRILRLAGTLADEVNSAAGSEVITSAWIAARLRYFRAVRRVYGYLLDRVHPRCLLVADPGEYGLVAAARERGIVVLELQHGLLDRHHSGYSWTSNAADVRVRVPVADRLLLFGDYYREELEPLGFWGGHLRVVGSPRIDHYREIRSCIKAAPKHLLVTTQGIDRYRVAAFIRTFMELLPAWTELHAYVKLHPIYDPDREVYEEQLRGEPKVKILAGHESPSTMELLVRSSWHVSISSSCHFDALALGVPTVVLAFESHNVMAGLVEAGHAAQVSTPQELVALVSRGPEAVPESVSRYYFQGGAVERICEEIHSAGGP